MKWVWALAAALLATGAAPARKAEPPLTVLTGEFAVFADATAAMPDAERVKLFRTRFDALLPGFYKPRERSDAEYDAAVLRALQGFPQIRERYDVAARQFSATFATASARFRGFFPDYRLTMPVYLVHSLGEMDGGTRTLRGRNVAVFGADVIARIHDAQSIGPFLDHELFHIHHARFFRECDALWCSVWQEGLAVYAASRLNPGADDRQLLLTIPRPIRAEVDARRDAAMCGLREKLDSTAREDLAPFFFARESGGAFPPRYGYYLGYLLAAKLGEDVPLARLAHLSRKQVRPLLERALATYRCPREASTLHTPPPAAAR